MPVVLITPDALSALSADDRALAALGMRLVARTDADIIGRRETYDGAPMIKEKPTPGPPRTPRPDRRAQREHNRRVGRMVTR